MINVGSVVYLLDKKTHTVVPCQIIEQVKSTTLEGEEVYHTVQTPNQKTLRLEDYGNPWFAEIEEAREFLLTAATTLISATIQKAVAAEEEYFPQAVHPLEISIKETSKKSPDKKSGRRARKKATPPEDNKVTVDLGEGKKVNVTLPEGMEIT